MDHRQALLAQSGIEFGDNKERSRWWDMLILAAATGVFIWLGRRAVASPPALNLWRVMALAAAMVISLTGEGWALWRHIRFS
jgi:hypothetical protein